MPRYCGGADGLYGRAFDLGGRIEVLLAGIGDSSGSFSGWDELLQSYLLGMAYPQHGEEEVFCLEDFKEQLLQYDPQLFDLEWELPLEEKYQL